MSAKTVVVLGATPKADRFANRAMKSLQKHGLRAIPVNPAFQEVLGETCYASISDVPGPVDTMTLYLGEARSTPLIADILAKAPRRIIFNPGAENASLERAAAAQGIEVVQGCTLVMLDDGTF